MKKSLLIYIYNSLNDPLAQTMIIKPIEKTLGLHNINVYLITYEQELYKIHRDQQIKIKNDLLKHNIRWIPLTWHSGRFKIITKIWDFLAGIAVIIPIRFLKNSKAIVTLGTVSGAFGYFISRLFRMKLIVQSYEPHSEFLHELDIWKKNSLRFKMLNSIERKIGINGEYLITGTCHMIHRLEELGSKAMYFRCPSAVDPDFFKFDVVKRNEIREMLTITHRKVLIYVGKFGDLYYKEEIPQLFSILKSYNPLFFFLVLTPSHKGSIHQLFINSGLCQQDFHIDFKPHDEIPHYISAADIGLCAIPPLPSQRFRSPVKTGEYLCSGIPYITCYGISEDDSIAEKYNVGVVISDFEKHNILPKVPDIQILLNEDPNTLRIRCRNTGLLYRNMDNQVKIFHTILGNIFRNK